MTISFNKTIVSLAFALAFTLSANAEATERFPWLTNLDEARALAASKELPLLIVFRCEP